MRLSLLMPTHERPETLRLAIASVRAQHFTDWELLVCGDGCGPATEALMAEETARDPRVRWFPLPKGPGFGYGNRNTVLAHARGDLIGFAAHDNLVFRDHWQRLVRAFDDPAIQLAASSAAWVDDDGRIVPTIFNLTDAAVRTRFIEGRDNRLPANAFVYRRALHDTVGTWNPDLPARGDLDLWGRILRHTGPEGFRFLPVIGFLHFRAIWKTADIADPHMAGLWPRLFAEAGRLPEALHQHVPAGVLPQQHCFARLHGPDGDAWEAAIREACAHAMETCAGEALASWAKALRDLERARRKVAERNAPPPRAPWWRRWFAARS